MNELDLLRKENQRLRELLQAALDQRFLRAHDDKWVAEAERLLTARSTA